MQFDIYSPIITNTSHDSNIHSISYIFSKLSQYTQTQLTYSIFGQAIFGVSLFGYTITYGSLNYASNIHDRMIMSSKIEDVTVQLHSILSNMYTVNSKVETTVPIHSIISEVV